MPSLNVFKSDCFGMMSLTNAINKLPYQPRLLQTLGIFKEVPVRTTSVWIEEQNGKLALIPQAARGSMRAVRTTPTRKATAFKIPHVPYFQSIMADDIQNLRAFGSETELEMMASYVNDQLAGMRLDHEVTQEYHRLGALKGVILDADGTTEIYDLFDEFGLTQEVVNLDWNDTTLAWTMSYIIRTIADKLGGTSFGQIYALCGDNYFDAVASHSSVTTAYERWRNGDYLRMSALGPEWYSIAANGFEYQNIYFINYRGSIGNITFMNEDEAYFFATGVNDLFEEIIGPADFVETVNTRGQRFYAKQQNMDFDKGIELHTQSNVLAMCKRPSSVIHSYICNFTGMGTGTGTGTGNC